MVTVSLLVDFDFSGDLVVVNGGECAEVGGTDGRTDARIFPAHVPVVALSKSPPSTGTRSAYWEECITVERQ